MRVGRVLVGVIVIGGVMALTIAGLRPRPTPGVEVQVGTVKKAPISRVVTGAGRVQPATTVKISSSLSGDLVVLSVKMGDRVTKGQLLGRIDPRRFEANAKQANAAHNATKADIAVAQVEVGRLELEEKRVQGLVDKGLASKAEQERTKAELAAAVARTVALKDRSVQAAAAQDEAKEDLEKTNLRSPIDGTVIELSREVGERVRGSDFNEDVVMTLAALSSMEVKLEVGEHEVIHLKNGQPAQVRIDAIEGTAFKGSVVEIGQKAIIRNQGTEQETTSFRVTVGLDTKPPNVMSGMSADVRVTTDQRESTLVVPVQAVTVRPSKMIPELSGQVEGTAIANSQAEAFAKVVFVVDGEQKAHLRRVRTGIASDSDIEVLEGLKEGERIVEGPYRTLAKELTEGAKIEEMKTPHRG